MNRDEKERYTRALVGLLRRYPEGLTYDVMRGVFRGVGAPDFRTVVKGATPDRITARFERSRGRLIWRAAASEEDQR